MYFCEYVDVNASLPWAFLRVYTTIVSTTFVGTTLCLCVYEVYKKLYSIAILRKCTHLYTCLVFLFTYFLYAMSDCVQCSLAMLQPM